MSLVAVLEAHSEAFRDRAMCLLPHDDVDPHPILRRVAGVRDLSLQITILGNPCSADGLPGVRLVAFSKLRLLHSTAGPSGPAQTFVGGYMPRLETVPSSYVVSAAEPACVGAQQIPVRLFQPEYGSTSIDS